MRRSISSFHQISSPFHTNVLSNLALKLFSNFLYKKQIVSAIFKTLFHGFSQFLKKIYNNPLQKMLQMICDRAVEKQMVRAEVCKKFE